MYSAFPLEIRHGMADNDAYILVLAVPEIHKQVPVLIGSGEAQAIVMAKEQLKARRPLTHDLMCHMMQEFMLDLQKVTIDRFEEGIFYSTLHINDGITDHRLDSRTTDAIVLALMQDCPISIDPKVAEETSMEPGALEDNLPENKAFADGAGDTLEQLEAQLRECEENEDYERAAEIQRRIERLTRGEQSL